MRNWLKMLLMVVCLGLGSCSNVLDTQELDNEVISAINSNNWPKVLYLKRRYFHLSYDVPTGEDKFKAIFTMGSKAPDLASETMKRVSPEVKAQAERYLQSLTSYDKLSISNGVSFDAYDIADLIDDLLGFNKQAAINILETHRKRDPNAYKSVAFKNHVYRLTPDKVSPSDHLSDCYEARFPFHNAVGAIHIMPNDCSAVFKANQCYTKYLRTDTRCTNDVGFCYMGVCDIQRGSCYSKDIYDTFPTCNSPQTRSPKDIDYY
ncbi:hypothetical protein [Lonepinella sp. BR2357]|uniref:hypothetical protein n=1 Tax=Lonepinella sp. BR2357 TaxID=3434549 RepID=UPI003F6DA82A